VYRMQSGTAPTKMPYLDRVMKIRGLVLQHSMNDMVLLDKLGPLLSNKVSCVGDKALEAELPTGQPEPQSSQSESDSESSTEECEEPRAKSSRMDKRPIEPDKNEGVRRSKRLKT